MAERCDAVVIGAGVVGLAVARALGRAGRDVLILERHDVIGSETSSRNSEVIHAGIYYPTGSLKQEAQDLERTARGGSDNSISAPGTEPTSSAPKPASSASEGAGVAVAGGSGQKSA